MSKANYLAILATSLFGQPAFAQDVRYEAVWNSGQSTSLVTAPLSRQAFVDTGQDLAESGLRLIDVETTTRGNRRVYAGLWTQGTGSNLFEGPMGPVDLREAMQQKRAQGMRLVDFELFRSSSGGRRYLAVWRNGSGEERLTGPMQQDAFFARGERLTQQGLRLIDVEVERVNGVLLYSGLFRTGTGSNLITAPLRRQAFRQKRDEMVAQGLELVDMERIRIGGTNRFVGVWSSGPGESRISVPREFGPFFIFAQDQFNDEKHTRDFELRAAVVAPEEPERPPGGGGGGGDGPDTSGLPSNPPGVSFTDSQRLRIQFTQIGDVPFTMELPLSWLPDYLPTREDGEPVLPDTFCAIHVRLADSIFWQVPGDEAVVSPPFLATPSVSALGSEFFNGGVEFEGPFGACSGTQTEWVFNQPFTTGETPFEPLPNMSLVIEGRAEISFKAAGAPEGELLEAHELFEDESLEALEALLEAFEELFEEGHDVASYCQTTGNFWDEFCELSPLSCPDAAGVLPECQ